MVAVGVLPAVADTPSVVCAELVGGSGLVLRSATTWQLALTWRCVSRRLNG